MNDMVHSRQILVQAESREAMSKYGVTESERLLIVSHASISEIDKSFFCSLKYPPRPVVQQTARGTHMLGPPVQPNAE